MISLSIIIVNWNAGIQLYDCLKSITKTSQKGFSLGHVVVVDNASSDDSLMGIDSLDLPLTIIRNLDNKGFGAACNQGAAVCDADYLLFLNPDTRLFTDSLSVPYAFMQNKENKTVGICGIQLVDEAGIVARTCARFPALSHFIAQFTGLNKWPIFKAAGMHMGEWCHGSTQVVDQVIGAFFFLRRKVFLDLKGFDERFFVYFEEVDLSLRAKQMGWRTVYLSEAQAFHFGGGTSEQVKATRLFYSIRSRLMYGFKHFPLWKAWSLLLVSLIIEPVTRVFFYALKRQWAGIPDTLQGYRMLWGSLPQVLKFRHQEAK